MRCLPLALIIGEPGTCLAWARSPVYDWLVLGTPIAMFFAVEVFKR